MQKTIFLVPTMYAREMVPNDDTAQKLASGSYMIGIKPKKPTAHSIAQKEYMQRRVAAGYKKLEILLPEHVYALLLSGLREGESMASLLERLILSNDDENQCTYGVEDK